MVRIRLNKIAVILFALATVVASGGSVMAQSQPASQAPRVSLDVNGVHNAQAYSGWPILIHGALFHPQIYALAASVSQIQINAQNGSWANAIAVSVVDENGKQQNWPVQLANAPSGSLTLGPQVLAGLVWVVSPSAAIAPGSYRVTATLNTTSSAGTTGWSGTVTSNAALVQIGTAPSAPSTSQQQKQAELQAQYDYLIGNPTQAIIDLNTLLAQQPQTVTALSFKGDLLGETGQIQQAIQAYDQAFKAFFAQQTGTRTEPPTHLLGPQRRLVSESLSQSGVRGKPEISINLLDQGVQSAGVFFLDLQLTNYGNDKAENTVLNQITFETTDGTGHVALNTMLTQLPAFTDFLAVNGSATVRLFVTVQGTVNSFSMTEDGAVADIFGTPAGFSQTQTIFLNGGGSNPVPLTIAAANATQQYGQPTPPLNNASYGGFVNGDTVSSLSGALACNTTATPSSPVGTYPITCSGLSSASYTITYVPGLLTVTPAPLTIAANSTSRPYGHPNLTFTASFNGFVNGDTVSGLSGSLGCATTAVTTSAVGTYAITCSGLTSTDYAINYASGLLTVTPAPLTIAANSTSRPVGQPNPSFTASISGFVNNDTVSSLSGTLVCTTTAIQSSLAGTYPINCSGLASTNYTITYISGQLTVAAPVCASNTTASVAIARSGFSYSPILKRYAQTLTLTNAGASAITGPIYIVLDNLSSSANVYTPSGSTACAAPLGSPYISIAGPLAASASTSVVLHFTDPTNAAIGYTARVLAGAGQP